MICDEVQSGFGRMGQWWGHEHHGVRADIVTMGKPVGNGHPLGVVVTTQEMLNEFHRRDASVQHLWRQHSCMRGRQRSV